MKKIPFSLGWRRDMRERLPWELEGGGSPVDLPDDYAISLPRRADAPGGGKVGYMDDGTGYYSKRFALPENLRGKVLLLQFDGAYMNAEVRFNDALLLQHPYGYTPFTADLTPFARFDMENTLSVTTHGTQPSSRWYAGAGIYREVDLLVGEPCYLDPRDLFVTSPSVSAESAAVRVAAGVRNTCPAGKTVTLSAVLSLRGVRAAEGAVSFPVPAGGKAEGVVELPVSAPALWSPSDPALYDLEIRVSAPGQPDDCTHLKTGIRKIEVSAADGLRINGQPLKLFGGCIHHDNGPIGARAMPRAEARKIENLKKAGFNAIRTAHNPPSTALLDACDRLGMLVLDEFFDCWELGKNVNDYHLWFKDWWQRDIEAAVRRDRNHPSVYCWSFGNEITEATGSLPSGPYWVKAQADFIRSLDPTRLVTCGGMFLPKVLTCDGFPGGPGGPPTVASRYCTEEEQVTRWKEMIGNLDIVSLNYSFRNYAQFHKLFPDVPLQGTETQGIDAWGNREAVRLGNFIIGDFVWTAHDNLGEAGTGRYFYDPDDLQKTGFIACWPWLSCFQGDLALDGERLPRSYYRAVINGLDAGIHLFVRHPAHTGQPLYGTGFHWQDVEPCWSYPAEYEGRLIEVEAYADCDEVEILVNGEPAAKGMPDQMVFRASVPYRRGEITAVAYRDGRKAAEDRILSAGPASRIVLSPDRTEIAADGMDLCYVAVTVADRSGRRVYGADRQLTAELEGPGCILGFGSNNPCTDENFDPGQRKSWKGRAVVVLRAGTEAGTLRLSVAGEGLERAETEIHLKR